MLLLTIGFNEMTPDVQFCVFYAPSGTWRNTDNELAGTGIIEITFIHDTDIGKGKP